MNKLLKGAIAGAAGLTLLLGGAGTFALWNASDTVTGGNIQAGNLTLTGGGAGVWKDAGGTDIPSISAYKIVPGDVLTYTKDLTATVTGNTLTAKLGLAAASFTPVATVAGAQFDADTALADFLTTDAVVSATGTGLSGDNPNYVIPTGATTITATVTITFPNDTVGAAGAENGAMLGSVNLDTVGVTLTQTV